MSYHYRSNNISLKFDCLFQRGPNKVPVFALIVIAVISLVFILFGNVSSEKSPLNYVHVKVTEKLVLVMLGHVM